MPANEPDYAKLNVWSGELKMENEFLEKSRSVLRPGSPVTEKYQFIESCKIDSVKYAYPGEKNVPVACRVLVRFLRLETSRSVGDGAPEGGAGGVVVVEIFTDSDETYGYRRVHAELGRRRDSGPVSSSAGPSVMA